MAFGGFSKEGNATPMAEINMIPLIDVMLVLLVIFIITAPLLTHAVKVDLPKAASQPNITKPDNVQLAIDAAGHVYWNGEVLDRSGLRSRMDAAVQQKPQPEVHIRGDAEITPDDDYEFADKVGAKYNADLRTRDQPGDQRVVVTIRPSSIITWGSAAPRGPDRGSAGGEQAQSRDDVT